MSEMYGLIMMQIKDVPHLNVKMSDACMGTSAAPNEFPPYYFEYNNTEFNLVDGLFVASMPVSFKSLPPRSLPIPNMHENYIRLGFLYISSIFYSILRNIYILFV